MSNGTITPATEPTPAMLNAWFDYHRSVFGDGHDLPPGINFEQQENAFYCGYVAAIEALTSAGLELIADTTERPI